MTPSVAAAVVIRRAVRDTTQRRLAARLQVSAATMSRTMRAIDSISAVLDALGLEVCARS